jgi:DNA-binding PadR family transcriptional regulator
MWIVLTISAAAIFAGIAVSIIDAPARRKRQAEERQVILDVIRDIQPNARGFTIQQEVERRIGRSISFGMLYVYLDEFEREGLLTSRWGKPVAERNGRRPRNYFIA